jgi:hypothetical protein
MTRRRQSRRPIKFTLRFYPGRDDDLICWLAEKDGEQVGAKTRAVKQALRDHSEPGKAEAVRGAGTAPALDLVEVRRVVEAGVASALGRFGGQTSGATVSTAAVEEDDEVEELLSAFQKSLVLGDD